MKYLDSIKERLSLLLPITILGSDYQLEKSFLKNNQGIFFFKKLAYVQ